MRDSVENGESSESQQSERGNVAKHTHEHGEDGMMWHGSPAVPIGMSRPTHSSETSNTSSLAMVVQVECSL